jgi:hypothetical protein
MENVGVYIAMAFGALMIALVLTNWKSKGKLGTAETVLLFFGLIALTLGTWATFEFNVHGVSFRSDRQSRASPNSYSPQPSPSSVREWNIPTPPRSLDVSGQYAGTLTESGRLIDITLNLQSEPAGTLSGQLAVLTRNGFNFNVEGQISGEKVIFDAPFPGTQSHLVFEGEFTGTSIKGTYTEVTGNERIPAGNFEVYK